MTYHLQFIFIFFPLFSHFIFSFFFLFFFLLYCNDLYSVSIRIAVYEWPFQMGCVPSYHHVFQYVPLLNCQFSFFCSMLLFVFLFFFFIHSYYTLIFFHFLTLYFLFFFLFFNWFLIFVLLFVYCNVWTAFNQASKFTSDLSKWDVSQVTTMRHSTYHTLKLSISFLFPILLLYFYFCLFCSFLLIQCF